MHVVTSFASHHSASTVREEFLCQIQDASQAVHKKYKRVSRVLTKSGLLVEGEVTLAKSWRAASWGPSPRSSIQTPV